jgi:Spy/CpxP family protein refolding chaperone
MVLLSYKPWTSYDSEPVRMNEQQNLLNSSGDTMINRTLLRNVGLALVMGTMVLSTAAYADHGGKGGPGRGDGMGQIEKMTSKLDLTADQQARIKALRDQFQAANATTLNEVKSLHEQARQQMQAGNKDQAKALMQQAKTKMESLRTPRENLMTQIKAVLTADQLAKLQQMKGDHEGKEGGEGHGKGWGRGRGHQGKGQGQNQVHGQSQSNGSVQGQIR